MFSERLLITLGLFLIGSLHTLIFAIFQDPGNFLLGGHSKTLNLACKAIFYSCAIGISLCNQLICRRIGLRKLLYTGLLFNLFGVTILYLNQFIGGKGILPFIFLDMVLFGLALTSVINALITYIVIEYPKKAGMAIVALFIFLNLGVSLAPIVIELFQTLDIASLFYPFLILLLLGTIWFIHVYFFDPPFPAHLAHLRKGSLIWKELHYRLGLYVAAIIAYGITETTFSLWGYVQIREFLGARIASEIVPFFWFFLIIGQIFLLLPLYFFPAKRVFYFLIPLIMGAGYHFSMQATLFGFVVSLIAAGVGCSAVFPILLSMMEQEIVPFARGGRLLFYIEMAVSLMLAGYLFGVGVIDMSVEKFAEAPLFPVTYLFILAVIAIAVTGAIALFLNLTASKRSE